MIYRNSILPLSKFTTHFLKLNNISFSSFKKWYLKPGMNFKDISFWWGKYKERKMIHEGIDLHYYINNFGNSAKIGKTSKFTAMFEGQVIQIFDDFKGKTIHIIHDIYKNRNDRLHSLYGHTKPSKTIKLYDYVNENSVIASLANDTKSTVPPHLHLTVFWASEYIIRESFDWEYINNSRKIELINPLPLISSLQTV